MLTKTVYRVRRLTEFAMNVSSLAPTIRLRVKTFVITLFVSLRQRVPWLPKRPVSVAVTKYGQRFTMYVMSRADLVIIEEVLVKEVYAEPQLYDPAFILDLGSHIGASIIYFRARYPNARILGVEPNPEIFPLLKKNVGALPFVEVMHAAVAAHSGTVLFYPALANFNSSTVAVAGDCSVEVPAMTLDQLIGSEASVNLLKVDVEGAEFDVFRADLGHVEAIAGEVHFGEATTVDSDVPVHLLSDFELRWTTGLDNPYGPWLRVASFVARRRTA
jgi:FkbM family methyltransferase